MLETTVYNRSTGNVYRGLCEPYQTTRRKIFPENNFGINIYVTQGKCFGDGTHKFNRNPKLSVFVNLLWQVAYAASQT